jgi:hypothetical protein
MAYAKHAVMFFYNLLIDEPELEKTTRQFSARKQVIEPTYIRYFAWIKVHLFFRITLF